MGFPRPSLGTKMALVASLSLSLVVAGLALFFLGPGVDAVRSLGKPLYVTLLIALTVGLTSAAFILLSRWFVDRPLRELMEVMDLTERKNFLVRAPVVSSDVRGELAKSFNRMLERITNLDASQIEAERQLFAAQKEIKLKNELALLHEFSQRVTSTLELDELYPILGNFLEARLNLHEFALLVWDEARGELVVKAAGGFADPARVKGMGFRIGEGITGRVVQSQESIYLPDTHTEKGYLYYKGEKREDGSFLSVPLLFKRESVGVMNFFRAGVDQFGSDDIRFLKTLAAEMAIAIANGRLYQKTRELSVRDELTGLYNRRHFQTILPLEIKRSQRFGKPLSLLMIDLDRFKDYNDRFGHREGDERLKEFSRVIGLKIREVDFFARFGGEEFVIILPGTSKKDAGRVAEKVRLLIRNHFLNEKTTSRPAPLTLSIGIAGFPEDAESVEELIDAADSALYEAKRAGRDRVVFFEKRSAVQSA